jgi:hypothetical protein
MSQPNLIRLGVAGDLQELSMFGRNYRTRWIDGLSRQDRASSGKLRRDVIAHKRGFLLTYNSIDQLPLDRLNELFEVDDELLLEVTHLTEVKTYTVLMGTFEQERILAVWGGLWGGVSIDFEEV